MAVLDIKDRLKAQIEKEESGLPVFAGDLYYEDPKVDLDLSNLIVYMGMFLPERTKHNLLKELVKVEELVEFAEYINNKELTRILTDLGFFVQEKG